jgi:hypothetical protein
MDVHWPRHAYAVGARDLKQAAISALRTQAGAVHSRGHTSKTVGPFPPCMPPFLSSLYERSDLFR